MFIEDNTTCYPKTKTIIIRKMLEFISQPIPWFIAGPIIGLTLPILLFIGNKHLEYHLAFNIYVICRKK